VDVRARAAPAPPAIPLADAVRLDVGAEPPQPLLFRRGPSTGNRLQPAADFRFSRTERVRLEVPLPPGASPGAGRLLDRAGQPLPIPVTVGERTDTATGQRWLTADLVLAPLAAGDYVVEFSLKHADREERTLTGLRVAR
jgi:hypothetical protein